MADVLLAVQMEKLRVEEALAARDSVVACLEDAYASVRQKAATILRLEQEMETLRRASSTPTNANCSLPDDGLEPTSPKGAPGTPRTVMLRDPPSTPDAHIDGLQTNSAYCKQISLYAPTEPTHSDDGESQEEPAERTIVARQAMLAALPLPLGIPDDALQPIVIHATHTLHEFLGNACGPLKDLLKTYRVLSEQTTHWCPDREEHGYFLTPMFKCNTNPRVTTAHRWSMVDLTSQMSKTMECFYNKDSKWYYAGTYKNFRMGDLSVKEWECLSIETTQAIVKETLAGRKNVSPQNQYETSQLYAAGALRVACIGLQCVGFNDELYRGVLEQARFVYWSRSAAAWA